MYSFWKFFGERIIDSKIKKNKKKQKIVSDSVQTFSSSWYVRQSTLTKSMFTRHAVAILSHQGCSIARVVCWRSPCRRILWTLACYGGLHDSSAQLLDISISNSKHVLCYKDDRNESDVSYGILDGISDNKKESLWRGSCCGATQQMEKWSFPV